MDMAASIVPKSDQLNADDLMSGPQTFTIEKVTAGSSEQPVDVHMIEAPGRAYRPSKSMRRVLVAAWGVEANAYIGRRLTLARDPHIKFGGIEVGGIIITHLSDISEKLSLALTVTRGKRSPFVVEPLTDATPSEPVEPTIEQVAASSDRDELAAMWKRANPALRKVIEARVAGLADVPVVGGVVSPLATPPEPDDAATLGEGW